MLHFARWTEYFPLTLTLSLGEREQQASDWCLADGCWANSGTSLIERRWTILPLPSMCLPSCRTVAAAILAAVEGGILPPGPEALRRKCLQKSRAISAGQDARLYGRQDACRYGKRILSPGERAGVGNRV